VIGDPKVVSLLSLNVVQRFEEISKLGVEIEEFRFEKVVAIL